MNNVRKLCLPAQQFVVTVLLALAVMWAPATALAAKTVLIVNGSSTTSETGTTADITSNLQAVQAAAGNTVTVVDQPPVSLAQYQEVWDIRFSNSTPLTAANQALYTAFLAAGNQMFIMGENASFMARNNSVIAFVQALGGGTMVFTTSPSTQTIHPPFTGTSISYAAPGGSTTAGTGSFATSAGGSGAAIAWSPGQLAAAPTAALVVVFDVNFMQTYTNSQAFLGSLVGFINVGGATNVLTPSSLTFAARTAATTSPAQTVTLTNNGSQPLAISSITVNGDFAFTTACAATVAAGATCTIDVTFTPLTTGTRTGALSVASNAPGSPHSVALSGTGQPMPVPVIEIAPPTLNFAPQALGTQSAVQIVTVGNVGNATLFFGPISTTGDFARRPVPAPAPGAAPRPPTYDGACNIGLAAGTSCDLAVAFLPTAEGPREGLLRIESNATQQPATVRLIGIGFVAVPPRILSVRESLAFAAQPVGTRSAGAPVTITNNSQSAVAISELLVTGDFIVSDTCTIVPARGTCTLLVTFRPTAEGDRTGRLTLRALSETEPYTVAFTGSGVFNAVPALEVSVTRAGFGNTLIGLTSTLEATLVNVGDVPVALGAITATGDFLVSHQCGPALAVGASCSVQLMFFPRRVGPQVGTLEVNSNAAGSPHQVQFSGTGCSFPSFARLRLHPLLCGP